MGLRDVLNSRDAWYVTLVEALDCPLLTLGEWLSRARGPMFEVVVPLRLRLMKKELQGPEEDHAGSGCVGVKPYAEIQPRSSSARQMTVHLLRLRFGRVRRCGTGMCYAENNLRMGTV